MSIFKSPGVIAILDNINRIEASEVARKNRPDPEPGLYYLDCLAKALARAQGHEDREQIHKTEILAAARTGALKVFDNRTDYLVSNTASITMDGLYFVVKDTDTDTWLAKVGAPYRLGGPQTPAPIRPMQRQPAADASILAKLIELGFDPMALPPFTAGKHSQAKLAARSALPYTVDMFDKAWKRLSNAPSRIKYAESWAGHPGPNWPTAQA